MQQHAQDLSDLYRRLENILAYGRVAEADHAGQRVRVDIGARRTDWLPWPAIVGRNFRAWSPIRIGTQVLVGSPSGDPGQAAIVQVLYSRDIPAPHDSEEVDLIQWDDGSRLEYNSRLGRLMIDCTGHLELRGETVTVHADKRLWVDCAGAGYRLELIGGLIREKVWRPDVSATTGKQRPEIDGDRKTGRRS